MSDAPTPDAPPPDAAAEAEARLQQAAELKARRRALGWSRGELAARAALDPRIIQLLELGQWTEGEAIGRARAVLIRAESGEADVQLPPVQAPSTTSV